MGKIKDGGPAFPFPSDDGPGKFPPARGMTLRDWFAGQALSAIEVDEWNDAERVALWAYQIADAMLAASEPKP